MLRSSRNIDCIYRVMYNDDDGACDRNSYFSVVDSSFVDVECLCYVSVGPTIYKVVASDHICLVSGATYSNEIHFTNLNDLIDKMNGST